MELNLFHNKTIGDVKRQFAKNFPYLKLEVFSLPQASRQGSLMHQRLNDNLSLLQVKTFYREGVFSFSPSTTIAAFKNLLQNRFGLSVQVFCKAGSLWLDTLNTSMLSLEGQNAMGEAASRRQQVNAATLFL